MSFFYTFTYIPLDCSRASTHIILKANEEVKAKAFQEPFLNYMFETLSNAASKAKTLPLV